MLSDICQKSQKQLQEEELEEILGETAQNSTYRDQEIGHLLQSDTDFNKTPFLSAILEKNRNNHHNLINTRKYSTNSHDSRMSHDSHHSHQHSESQSSEHRQSFGTFSFDRMRASKDEEIESQINQFDIENQKEETHMLANIQDKEPKLFRQIEWSIKRLRIQSSLEGVKNEYQNFVVSEPSYKIDKSHQEQTFPYNTLKQMNIICMDVGYCEISQNYRIVIGADDGRVAIFEKDYSKPVNIFQAFEKTETGYQASIRAAKWSQNLEFLTIASSQKELKVFSFKQPIIIEDQSILRMRKQPIELISITKKSKQLEYSIVAIQYISEVPLEILLIDQHDQIWLMNYRKHIISYRPYLSQLPIKFNDVFDVKIKHSSYQLNFNKSKEYRRSCTLIAVSSQQFVTICLLKPYFEVIIAYDKEKRAKSIDKSGYAHIAFRKNGILIVWGKFANLLGINISGYTQSVGEQIQQRVSVRINNVGSMLLPENTLLAGLVTNTLMFQLSQSGIKIYSCTAFTQNNKTEFIDPIYEYSFSLFELPSGMGLLEQLSEVKYPSLNALRHLHSYLQSHNNCLFMTTNTSLFSVTIKNFEEHIHNIIQNINNWKVGLQMLVDCYHGKFRNYDNMTSEIIMKNAQEYVYKYINFLETVIGTIRDPESNDQEDSGFDKKKREIWDQEVIFVFNIVIEIGLFRYLGDILLPKLHQLYSYTRNCLKEGLSANLAPFIKLKKIPVITYKMLKIMFSENINKSVISYLLLNIDPEQNQIDLAHQLNQLLLAHHYYLELIIINHMFSDFYTPFVVLISHYQNSKKQLASNKQSQEQERERIQKLRELLAWSIYVVLCAINQNFIDCPYASEISDRLVSVRQKLYKTFLPTILPLFQSSLIPIFLSSSYEVLLFERIIHQLYYGRCLQVLNDMSNKLMTNPSSQQRDIMTEIIHNIDTSKIGDMKKYWLCVISLSARFVIRFQLFMGIRYLTSHSVDDSLIEPHLSAMENHLQQQFSKISQSILEEYFAEIQNTDQSVTLIVVLGKLTNNHIKVMHSLISNKKARGKKLYLYLQQNMEKMNHKQISDLQNIIDENLQVFMEMGIAEFCSLIMGQLTQYRTPQNKLHNFIQKQQINNQLRLHFIQYLLTQVRKTVTSNSQVNKKAIYSQQFIIQLQLVFIEMLAKNNRNHQILLQIQNYEYPIDESLHVCREYGIDDAQAFLLVRSGGEGDIPTAINLYFKIVGQKFGQYIRKPHYHSLSLQSQQDYPTIEKIMQNFLQYFNTIVSQCIVICGEVIDEYFHVANKLKQIKFSWYHIYDAYLCDLIVDEINNDIYPGIASSLVRTLPVSSLITYLGYNLTEIDLILTRAVIAEILKNILYQKQVYILTQQSFVDFEEHHRKQIVEESLRGFTATSICDLCKELDINGIVMHYNDCGHNIHPTCSEDIKICLLCKNQNDNIMKRIMDQNKKVKTELYSVTEENIGEWIQQSERLRQQRRVSLLEKFKQYDQHC